MGRDSILVVSGGTGMKRSGFTTIEMVIVVVLIGLIAAIGFPKIRQSLDKANVRSARAAVGTLAATARSAAIQRGCPGVIHFVATNATVWVTTSCPTKVDTISGVQQLSTRFKVTIVATRDSVRYDPRGLSLDNLNANTVIRFTGSVGSNVDSTVINPLGKVIH
ncbi:MAG TPA: prepilin-type N-terminal cleavage/methylation domain-containing protein [Gemmatimonadales bacterium]|nr:prepilin-type N-terminal cleavage/methylation domain-containing protein [Gemmatimonadales bacterium]